MRKSKVRDDVASAKRSLRAERPWNSTISVDVQPKRHTQMSKDIKKFLLRSIDVNPDHKDRQRIVQSRRMEAINMFSCISSTLDFNHHEGTDYDLELKVVKIILVRENLLMGLQYLNEKTKASANVDNTCMNILESLAQIRESTLNYLEALCLWRQAAPNANILSPRVFFWDGSNYTIKIVRDLDFLSHNHLIIDALHLNADQFRSNPLMLTNNLYDPDTWMDPVERASLDADGCPQGNLFEARLRLRFAERILLQEIELTGINETAAEDPESNVFLTQPPPETRFPPASQIPILPSLDQDPNPLAFDRSQPSKPQVHTQRLLKGSSALEYDDDGSYDDLNELAFNDLSGKSVWEEERVIYRTDSGNNLAVSRASTISKSAGPSSSRLHTGSLPSSRGGTDGLSTSRPAVEGDGLEYGHDFFSGHWAESRVDGLNPLLSHEDFFAEELLNDDIYFVDDGTPVHPDLLPLESLEVKEESSSDSVHAKPIECLTSADLHIISNIRQPSRNLLLAGSICVILLTRGSKIPSDVSWTAFVKLCNLVDVSKAMQVLDLLRVSKFKLVAIKPYLQQVTDDVTLVGLESTDLPFTDFIVGNKLVVWVKQFTTAEVTKQQKSVRKPIVSKSGSPMTLSPVAVKTQPPAPIRSDAVDSKLQQQGSQGRYKVKGMEKFIAKGKNKSKNEPKVDKRTLALNNLPVARNKIPKVDLEIVPFYSEVVDTMHANPVMVALLSTNPLKPSLDRLSIKVYDIITSVECIVNVNMREYTLFQKELDQQLRDAAQFFEPTDPQWWIRNVSKILIVQGRVHNKLYVIISKKAIESLVVDAIKDREAIESAKPVQPIALTNQQEPSMPRDDKPVLSDSSVDHSEEASVTPVSTGVLRDMGLKRASIDSYVLPMDATNDQKSDAAAALVVPSMITPVEVREQEQHPAIVVNTALTDLPAAVDDLYDQDFVSDNNDEPLSSDRTTVVENTRVSDESDGGGPAPWEGDPGPAIEYSVEVVEVYQPDGYTAPTNSDDIILTDDDPLEYREYEDITSSVMNEAMGSLLNTEGMGSHNYSSDGLIDYDFEESSEFDLEKILHNNNNNNNDNNNNNKKMGAAEKMEKEDSKGVEVVEQEEEEEEGEDPAVDQAAATEEEDEEGHDFDDDVDAASNYDDDFDNITIKNESPGDKYEPASNYADDFDNHSIDSDNQYADPVCDVPEEEPRPVPHNNQHESDEYDRERIHRSDNDDDYDYDDLENDRRYDDDDDDDFDMHSGHDEDDDAYALRVVQSVLADEYGDDIAQSYYGVGYDSRAMNGDDLNNQQSNACDGDYDNSITDNAQPNYDLVSYGEDYDYDSSNAYPNNQLSNADDFDTNIAQPHNQLSYADDFDSSIAQPNDENHYADDFDSATLQQHNDRSYTDDFDNMSKEGPERGFDDDMPDEGAAVGRLRRYQEEDSAYVLSSDGEADLKADNISTDGEVGMDDVGMGLSSEGEDDAPGLQRSGDGLSALERVQREFEEGGEDDTEYLIDFD